GGDKYHAPQAVDLNAEVRRGFIAEAQQIHVACVIHEHDKSGESERRDERDFVPGWGLETAHQPEQDRMSVVEIDHAVHQHDRRAPERIENYADQKQRERLELSIDLGKPIDRDGRGQRRAERNKRDDGGFGATEPREKYQRDYRAERIAHERL